MPEEEKDRGMLPQEMNDAAKQKPSESGQAVKNDRMTAGEAEGIAGIRENAGCETEKTAAADAEAEKEELEALLGEFLA